MWHLCSVGPTSKTLSRRLLAGPTDAVRMFCACWEDSDYFSTGTNNVYQNNYCFFNKLMCFTIIIIRYCIHHAHRITHNYHDYHD